MFRWFKTKRSLIAELKNLDRAVRVFQDRQFVSELLCEELQDVADEITAKSESSDLILSALGAAEISKARHPSEVAGD